MNDEFLSLLAQAQQAPQPPTAQAVSTNTAPQRKDRGLSRTFKENIAENLKITASTPAFPNGVAAAFGASLPAPPYEAKSPLDNEDALRLYLGLNQKNDTFEQAQFTPSKKTGDNARYYRYANEKNRDAIRRTAQNFLRNDSMMVRPGGAAKGTDIRQRVIYSPQSDRTVAVDIGEGSEIGVEEVVDRFRQGERVRRGALGQYTLDKGKDDKGHYVSYYDKWDFGGFRNPAESIAPGKPFDVYGRFYYDPKTKEIRDNQPQPQSDNLIGDPLDQNTFRLIRQAKGSSR